MALVGAAPIVCPSVLSVYLMRWWFQCGALDGSFFFFLYPLCSVFFCFSFSFLFFFFADKRKCDGKLEHEILFMEFLVCLLRASATIYSVCLHY